jgi:hypothetical protein
MEKLVSCEGLHASTSTKCTMNGVKLYDFLNMLQAYVQKQLLAGKYNISER